MDDSTAEVSGGTESSSVSGSQTSQAPVTETGSADGGSTPPEPTIDVDGEAVPLSKLRNALKVESNFTKEREQAKAREQSIAEREARVVQSEVTYSGLEGLLQALQDPKRADELVELVPELKKFDPSQVATTRMLADNMRLRFELFAKEHAEYTETELAGIRAEAVNLARAGRVAEASDYETIGLRLYREGVLERERTKGRLEAEEAAKAKAEAERRGATLHGGMPALQGEIDTSKLSALDKISLGRKLRAAANKR